MERNTYHDRPNGFVERLRPDIVVERFVSQSPKEMKIAPQWGLKNHEFTDRLLNYMTRTNAQQGRLNHALGYQ